MQPRSSSTPAAADLCDRYGHLALFENVDMAAVTDLLAECDEIVVAAGDTVLAEGSLNDAIYVILEGELNIRLGSVNGTPIVHLGVGACVGELSILSQINVTAFVTAAHTSRLLVIRDDYVWALIGGSHDFACNLLKTLAGRVRADNTRLQLSLNAQDQLARASRVDALTGLYNRRWLDDVLERQCERCATDGTPLSLILLDVDHFKQINDCYGHLRGDEALKQIAMILRNSTRPIDLAARFGGEEFALVLYGIDLFAAAEIADRVRRDVMAANVTDSVEDKRLTVSLGVAEMEVSCDPIVLLDDADRALYQAKHLGRNRVVVASDLTRLEIG